jgi:23S rRNA (cytosine1962-C5)-methyltransferase
MTPTARVTRRGADRVRGGHPWIYRSDLVETDARGGDTVRVVDVRDRTLGYALYSDRSEIALRMITLGDRPADLSLWRARLEQACAYRRSLRIDATAYRLVHAEADRLPSFVVDRYDQYLVVQTLSQGTDRMLPELVRLLVEVTQPKGVLARNDPRVRRLEGLEPRVELLYGEVPSPVVIREGDVEFEVDLWKGQKTGAFLDQRENRDAAAAYAHGRLLDAFSYQGAFAVRLARRCREVIALDSSEDAVAQIGRNATRNGLRHVAGRVANVFDALREFERAGERFDTIVLDPPAFAKNKAAVPKALAGYKEINLRAMKLLAPGGVLVTCSCSYNVDDATFGAVVVEAAADARASLVLVEKRLQSRDHPILVGFPESAYLKCLILRKLEP